VNLKTLFKITYGMYIVSSNKDSKLNGQIANTVFQVTANPPMIAVCINKENLTHECITSKKAFSVAILSVEAPMTYIGTFGFKTGRNVDKFNGLNFKTGTTGVPIPLDYCVGYLEAEVAGSIDQGTHTLFTGKIIEAEVLNDKEPMTYAYYHQVKGGKTQKNAPTFVADEPKKG
jgi:flavin reductase (DIM6/NTAB) family NADH-FMN oxidoreductase RutF